MTSDSELENMAGSTDMPVPEMIFGANKLECTHVASGTRIVFGALDALRSTRIERDASGMPDRHCFGVPYANLWDNKDIKRRRCTKTSTDIHDLSRGRVTLAARPSSPRRRRSASIQPAEKA